VVPPRNPWQVTAGNASLLSGGATDQGHVAGAVVPLTASWANRRLSDPAIAPTARPEAASCGAYANPARVSSPKAQRAPA
jgi:hypothetical protein